MYSMYNIFPREWEKRGLKGPEGPNIFDRPMLFGGETTITGMWSNGAEEYDVVDVRCAYE